MGKHHMVGGRRGCLRKKKHEVPVPMTVYSVWSRNTLGQEIVTITEC